MTIQLTEKQAEVLAVLVRDFVELADSQNTLLETGLELEVVLKPYAPKD